MSATYENDPGVQCMLAWQAGDESAFDRLVEDHSQRLFGLFTRFMGNSPEREDLVQETFLRVLRARDSYEPKAAFSTWLYRIAFNLAVNRSQRTRSTASLEGRTEGSEPEDESPEPSSELEREDVVHAVRAAIASLPDNQRMALVLARYEELSFAEIAVVLDSSEKAIKSLVHRARENLRERLAPFLDKVSP